MTALTPEMIHAIDSARIKGAGIASIRASLARAGHDPHAALAEYAATPFANGKRRDEVNLSDPREWPS